MIARISRIALLVRGTEGVTSAVDFYTKCIGLQAWRVSEDLAELVLPIAESSRAISQDNNQDNVGRIVLNIQAVDGTEAQLSVGYSPLITFQLDPGEMDSTISSSVQAGAHLDGPIQYRAFGKIASLRTPQGHMIGLFEPKV